MKEGVGGKENGFQALDAIVLLWLLDASMAHSRLSLLAIGVILIFQIAARAATPTPEVAPSIIATEKSCERPMTIICNGKYKGGRKPSDAELKEILGLHAEWLILSGGGYDPAFANDSKCGYVD